MRCGKVSDGIFIFVVFRRNPHECAVAKVGIRLYISKLGGRNPHECAVAKINRPASG